MASPLGNHGDLGLLPHLWLGLPFGVNAMILSCCYFLSNDVPHMPILPPPTPVPRHGQYWEDEDPALEVY